MKHELSPFLMHFNFLPILQHRSVFCFFSNLRNALFFIHTHTSPYSAFMKSAAPFFLLWDVQKKCANDSLNTRKDPDLEDFLHFICKTNQKIYEFWDLIIPKSIASSHYVLQYTLKMYLKCLLSVWYAISIKHHLICFIFV
jgi:hypothetical protein